MKAVPRSSKVHGSLPLEYVAAFFFLEICNNLLAGKGFNTAASKTTTELFLTFWRTHIMTRLWMCYLLFVKKSEYTTVTKTTKRS